jgi:XTP/dITP diphosphohydrolase
MQENTKMKLLIASHNPGKIEEYRHLLSDRQSGITSLAEEGITLEPEETGVTFEENAIQKAVTIATQSGLPTLADDSGLEIDALGGAPGVYSARYGGTGRGEDIKRYQLVLQQMMNVPWEKRTARFRCVIALAVPGEPVRTANGSVEGFIARQPEGEHGFGYDPIFFVPEFECTMAQLPAEVKNRISHRARALQAAQQLIEDLFKTEAAG